ncbi:MAG: Wzz/FepE/Etk N-terminal domain-containing protein [Geodermatophilaceae bacterium]
MLDSTVRPPQLSDYGALIRRQWWLVALAVLLGLAGGVWYTSTQPLVYRSTTEVLVTPTGVDDDAVSASSRTRAEINLDTEAQLLTSTAVVARAADTLGLDSSVEDLADRVRVTVPPNTEVLSIAFTADTASVAQEGANAFAVAYLTNRGEAAKAEIAARQQSRQAQVLPLTESLREVTDSLVGLAPGSAARAVAEAQVQSLSSQIAVLTAEVNALASTPLTPGRIITEATLPSRPSSPVLPVNLAGGAMLGFLLGCVLALLRQRSDRRLRSAEEVTRVTGLSVLVTIPESSGVWLADPTSAAGRGYVRLRNVLTARVAPDARIILIAGIDADGSEVADNLAATLARTGAEVVLVSTHAGSATAQRLGLARRWAGLSEVLGGQATTSAALQVPPGLETLRVLIPGQDPQRAADLLETEAAANLLSGLRRSARYVILEAPPASSSAQAQTLAALADIALVVIRARTTSANDVDDAIEQFTAVRTPLIGSVLVPPGRRQQRRWGRWAIPSPSRQSSDPPSSNIAALPENATQPLAVPIERPNRSGGGLPHQTKRSKQGSGPRRTQTPAAGDGNAGRGSVSRSAR